MHGKRHFTIGTEIEYRSLDAVGVEENEKFRSYRGVSAAVPISVRFSADGKLIVKTNTNEGSG